MTGRVYVLGVRVDNVDEEEALERIQTFVEESVPRQIVTLNPEFLVMAWDNPSFRRVLNSSDLALADGMGLLWAARIRGTALKARVTGVDTIRRLARLAAERGYRVFLLGAKEGVAEAAARALVEQYPNLKIAGTYAGSPAEQEEDEIVERIRNATPHILLVAYGAPQQDLWIHRNKERAKVPVSIGIGGSFDFISGVVQRAPPWIQGWGLEWLYRLMQEPWRWRRMLRLLRFVGMVAANKAEDSSSLA